MFCLSPREPVGPAGLCAQGLGRSCSETVLLGVVPRTQPGHLSVDMLLWAWVTCGQLVSYSWPESCKAGWFAALGLGRHRPFCSFGPESHARLAGPAPLGLSFVALRSASLGLCVGQLASAPGALPPNVSGVGSPLGFQVWLPAGFQ